MLLFGSRQLMRTLMCQQNITCRSAQDNLGSRLAAVETSMYSSGRPGTPAVNQTRAWRLAAMAICAQTTLPAACCCGYNTEEAHRKSLVLSQAWRPRRSNHSVSSMLRPKGHVSHVSHAMPSCTQAESQVVTSGGAFFGYQIPYEHYNWTL